MRINNLTQHLMNPKNQIIDLSNEATCQDFITAVSCSSSTNGSLNPRMVSETSGRMNSLGGVSPDRNICLSFVPLNVTLSDSWCGHIFSLAMP